VGVVHHRCEEVHRLHECRLLVETEDAGVVAGALVDEHARVVGWNEGAQDLGELGGAELARSTRAAHLLGHPPDPLAIVAHIPPAGPEARPDLGI
jgi:hypothetical protein